MENQEFGFHGVEAKFSCSNEGLESMEEVNGGKQFNFNGAKDWVSDFGFYQQDLLKEGFLFSKYRQEEEEYQTVSPTLQTCLEEIDKLGKFPASIPEVEPQQEKQHPFPLASLELLSNYKNRFKQLNVEERYKFSTEEIIRLAGAKFIWCSSKTTDDLSMLSHPFDFSFYGLSNEEKKDVELVGFLFASAEKVGYQQFYLASKLLNECDRWSSNTGDPVRQVPAKLACYEGLPFSQVAQYARIQAIIEIMVEPNRLESIMGVVRSINPCVMVVTEVEANHNSPAFDSRFIEALFFFSAYFDCIETFMKRDNPNRMIVELEYFGEGIRSIVATEGEERKV
ncbi:hypothetical protein FH972_015327 [Carpinus fangiana]|uniref:Uncharacterized protein n=1 Tax=Carpinus fangiana TaxID=176857 RepID=A0A5N6RCG8_9ROSI|nr:hypothetical protein FH972_015327 [Carpinus fangiana]